MKTITIICLLCAIGSCAASLFLFSSANAQLKFYRAHNAIELIASRNDASDELKTAVMNERQAAKEWSVGGGLERIMVWPALGFASLGLIVTVFACFKKD